MRNAAIAVVLIAFSLAGCQSVHTAREDGVPVALWSSVLLASRENRPEGQRIRQMVARALKEAGVDAAVDDQGVTVPEGQERRAREVLLTDRRLADTDIIVLLAVPAGSGRKTAAGFEIPQVAPDEAMRFPSTQSSH